MSKRKSTKKQKKNHKPQPKNGWGIYRVEIENPPPLPEDGQPHYSGYLNNAQLTEPEAKQLVDNLKAIQQGGRLIYLDTPEGSVIDCWPSLWRVEKAEAETKI